MESFRIHFILFYSPAQYDKLWKPKIGDKNNTKNVAIFGVVLYRIMLRQMDKIDLKLLKFVARGVYWIILERKPESNENGIS